MRVTCPALSSLDGIEHGFFTREGGVSTGTYASLNCGFGSGDDLAKVAQNRAYVARALGVDNLCTAHQIHSPTTVILSEPWEWKNAPEADALATRTPGIAIGVLTADCLPILMADATARVIAAAHAGWKGAISGVVESAIAAMETLGAQRANIAASIGPAIAYCSYEVGEEFRARFLEESVSNEAYFTPSSREGHSMFDLKSYAQSRLQAAGIGRINVLAHDTCLEENTFFSYRRACLQGETVYGRQVSAITLK